jgi:hypothetical protein
LLKKILIFRNEVLIGKQKQTEAGPWGQQDKTTIKQIMLYKKGYKSTKYSSPKTGI